MTMIGNTDGIIDIPAAEMRRKKSDIGSDKQCIKSRKYDL